MHLAKPFIQRAAENIMYEFRLCIQLILLWKTWYYTRMTRKMNGFLYFVMAFFRSFSAVMLLLMVVVIALILSGSLMRLRFCPLQNNPLCSFTISCYFRKPQTCLKMQLEGCCWINPCKFHLLQTQLLEHIHTKVIGLILRQSVR